MGSLLPDLRINPYVQSYVGNANQEYGNALKQKITDYDVAKSYDDALGVQTDTLLDGVGPFEKDRARAIELQDYFRKRIEDRSGQGDYENMVAATARDARDFMRKFQPLQENYKRYSDWVKKVDESNDYGTLTKEHVKRKVLSDYKGIDFNNITGSMFQGFTPAKDIQLGKEIDELVKGIATQEWGDYTLQPDGSVIKENQEIIREETIAQLVRSGLASRQDIRDFETTQRHIGLGELFDNESRNALNQAIAKYAKNNYKKDIGWQPGYDWSKTQSSLNGVFPTTGFVIPPGVNPYANITGTEKGVGASMDAFFRTNEQGDLVKIVDKNGNIVPREVKSNYDLMRTMRTAGSIGSVKDEDYPYTEVPASPEEILKANQEIDANFKQLYDQTVVLPQNMGTKTNIPGKTQKEKYDNLAKTAAEAYDKARTVVSGEKIYVDKNKNKAYAIDDIAASNLNGYKVFYKSTDPEVSGLPKEGETGKDFQAMVNELAQNGWAIEKQEGDGIIYNPYGQYPASNIKLTLKGIGEDNKGITKMIDVGAEMPEHLAVGFKPMQDVLTAIHGLQNTEVPFFNGYKFRVNTGIDLNNKEGVSKVILIRPDGKVDRDANGNEISSSGKDFTKFYKGIFDDILTKQ